jgi:Stress responsive A/B Barrel Domain
MTVGKTSTATFLYIICLFICPFASSFAVNMPVKHIVMFRFKEGTTEEEIQGICQELLALPKAIDCIRSYEVGQDLLLEGGQKHPLGPNRRVAWTATFDSANDYETYNSSEAHLAFLQKLKPLLDPGSRAAIQYEIPTKET